MSASGLAWKEGAIDFSGAQMVATLKLIAVSATGQLVEQLSVLVAVSRLL